MLNVYFLQYGKCCGYANIFHGVFFFILKLEALLTHLEESKHACERFVLGSMQWVVLRVAFSIILSRMLTSKFISITRKSSRENKEKECVWQAQQKCILVLYSKILSRYNIYSFYLTCFIYQTRTFKYRTIN